LNKTVDDSEKLLDRNRSKFQRSKSQDELGIDEGLNLNWKLSHSPNISVVFSCYSYRLRWFGTSDSRL